MRAFVRHEPTSKPVPLVFDSPHSGTHYPADFDHLPPFQLGKDPSRPRVERAPGGRFHARPWLRVDVEFAQVEPEQKGADLLNLETV